MDDIISLLKDMKQSFEAAGSDRKSTSDGESKFLVRQLSLKSIELSKALGILCEKLQLRGQLRMGNDLNKISFNSWNRLQRNHPS